MLYYSKISKILITDQTMNRTEIEQAVLKETHTLPLNKVEETLNVELCPVFKKKNR